MEELFFPRSVQRERGDDVAGTIPSRDLAPEGEGGLAALAVDEEPGDVVEAVVDIRAGLAAGRSVAGASAAQVSATMALYEKQKLTEGTVDFNDILMRGKP